MKIEKIPVVAKDLLDSYPRKVYFPQTGRALVKKLHRVHNETLFGRENDYKARLSGPASKATWSCSFDTVNAENG